MSTTNKSFDNKKTKKSWFYKNKKLFQIDDIDANEMLVPKKEPYGTKNDNYVITSLCLRLPQITGYAKKFNANVTMSFGVKNKQLLKNYNKIWEKIEKLI